jgi:pilus assembly protein FimV
MGSRKTSIPLQLTHCAIAAICVIVCIPSAHALSLGRFNVQSLMGEPLRAEVEVTQANSDELRGLSAQVASPASFSQAGMEFNPGLANVRTRVEKRNDGSSFIVLTGTTPILDTFVDLILETRWSSGSLVKNYAMLLTASNNNQVPPTTSKNAAPVGRLAPAAPVNLAYISSANASDLPLTGNSVGNSGGTSSSVPQPSGVNAKNVPVYRFDNLESSVTNGNKATSYPVAEPAPAVSAKPYVPFAGRVQTAPRQAPNDENASGKTVTVPKGSTATQLVAGYLQGNVSLDQMLIALLRANPHAFINGNVNLIRAGSTVRIPSTEEAAQIDLSEAHQTIVAQSRDFGTYARKLASTPIAVGAEDAGRTMSGKISAKVKEDTTGIPGQDKLTLSKKDSNEKGSESEIASEKKTSDESSQIAALNKNIEALSKLQAPEEPSPVVSAPIAVVPEAKPDPGLIERLTTAPDAMAWAAGLLAVMVGLAFYIFKRNARDDNFASSLPEYPPRQFSPESRIEPKSVQGIHPDIAGLDLNLGAPARDETGTQKLQLAEQLIAKGDQDLARTLLMSLVTSPNSNLKNRAVQLLGQLK